MAFCTECGHQLAEGAKFCFECGAKVNAPSSTRVEQRKTVYDGEIHKCPNCGESIGAYDTICQSCGYEIRGRKTTSVVHELALKLENTSDPQKKDELIRTFYIPNTREDIHEFFMLALSQVKIGGMNTDAWMVKLEQAYQKAELSFRDTPEFERLKPMYEKAVLLNKKNSALGFIKDTKKYFKSGYAWALLFLGLSVVSHLLSAIIGVFTSGMLYELFSDLTYISRMLALLIAFATLVKSVWKSAASAFNSICNIFKK